MSDKRAQFFLLAAGVCVALVPVAEEKYRALTIAVAATYVVLAILSALDHRSRG